MLFEEEEKILKEVLNSIESQISDAARKLRSEESRARILTGAIVLATKDEEKQLMASDEAVSHALLVRYDEEFEALERLKRSPYFARIVIEENGKENEYKIGRIANAPCRIIDWKHSPIAKLYYEYKEGEHFFEDIQGKEREGIIKKRVLVTIENGILKHVSRGSESYIKTNDGWISGTLNTRSFSALPDIAQLITKEQYSSITTDSDSPVLIQGIAGSGKTTVAIYRLSWMIKEKALRPDKTLIILKSSSLKSYIAHSLESFNLSGVVLKTWDEFLEEETGLSLPKPSLSAQLEKQNKKYFDDFEYTPSEPKVLIDSLDLTYLLRFKQLNGSYSKKFSHVVIDEVQDFSLPELMVILGLPEKKDQVTVVGDIDQALNTGEFPGWSVLMEKLSTSLVKLEVAHRSTQEIMNFASRIRNEPAPQSSKRGRRPIWFHAPTEELAVSSLIDWLKLALEKFPTEPTAVICNSPEEARTIFKFLTPSFDYSVRQGTKDYFSFDAGIIVTNVELSKGLEWRSVLLWNPKYHDKNSLYVGATRAEENLAIVTYGKISKHLPPPIPELVRYHVVESPTEKEEPSIAFDRVE